MMNNQLTNRLHPFIPWILFLILALLWSGSFINIKLTVNAFAPLFAAGMRIFISFICLALFFTLRGKTITLPFKDAWPIWCTGLCTQGIPFALLFSAEQYVTPGVASIINSTVSLWSLLLGVVIFRDVSQFNPNKLLGVLLGISGMLIIFSPSLDASSSPLGLLLLTGMSIAYAIGALLTQHVIFKNPRITFETNIVQQHMASLLLLMTLSACTEPTPEWRLLLDPALLSSFLYLGMMATALAWMIYFYLIKRWGAVTTGTVMYLVPILAILWDFLFLDITPTLLQLFGTTTILLGVILIQSKRRGFGWQLAKG